VLRGSLGDPGRLVVHEERLGIRLAQRLQRRGEALVVLAQRVRRERGDDRLADAVVEALEAIVALAADGANELGAVEDAERRLGVGELDLRRLARDAALERASGDREHLEQSALALVEAREAILEHRRQAHVRALLL